MTQWTGTDEANGAPLWALSQLNTTANTSNRDALFGNTTADSFVTGKTVGIFGVSGNELGAAGGYVSGVSVANAGSGFTARPTVTISASQGSLNATATAVGVVVNVAVNEIGDGYANGDVIEIDDGTGTAATFEVTTGAANASVASLEIVNAGAYTTLPTLSNSATSNTSGDGTGATVDVVIGLGPITVTNTGIGYTSATATIGGAGGSGASATVAITKYEGASAVAHTGWQLRTVGSGGRAGRVHYETLVAGGISTDASDDATLPE